MTVREKINSGYYNKKDIDLYNAWIENGKCEPEFGNEEIKLPNCKMEFAVDYFKEHNITITEHPTAFKFFECCWNRHYGSYSETHNEMENWFKIFFEE